MIKVRIDDRQVVVDKQLTDLFNELIGGDLNTTKDVKNAIKKTRELIAQTRKLLREAEYLRKLISSTVVPMCGDIGLKDKANSLLSEVERTEASLEHTEAKLEWLLVSLYEELERAKRKEKFERRKRLYKYMKEHLL